MAESLVRKVFGIGWARTGTTTLASCLKYLGFNHHGPLLQACDAVVRGEFAGIFEIASRFESFDDWPWILLFRELDEAFPGSRFVLTRRDPERWLRSYRNMLRNEVPDEELADLRRSIYGVEIPGATDEQLINRYLKHQEDVLEYFQGRPRQLLVVDWEKGDGWKELCGFLGEKAPDVRFPHENAGDYVVVNMDCGNAEHSKVSYVRKAMMLAASGPRVAEGDLTNDFRRAVPELIVETVEWEEVGFSWLSSSGNQTAVDSWIEKWVHLVKPGGILAGDGLERFPEVRDAVMQWFDVVHVDGDNWLVRFPVDDLNEDEVTPRSISEVVEDLLGGVRHVAYVPNPGNAGDAVIAHATAGAFSRLGIVVDPGSDVLLVAGGGNLVPQYHHLEKLLRRLPKSGIRVIILPSTVLGCFALLREFEDLILLARERVTWRLAREEGIHTILCHDAAFDLEYDDWMIASNRSTRETLMNFRIDCESATGAPSSIRGNRDLSEEFGNRLWDFETASEAARRFVSEINLYRQVETDRLHVAIVAACLGKQVRLFPNCYHKNRSVWLNSLSGFPNVRFVE